MIELEFVDYESPEQAKSAVKLHTVKSRAARYRWARATLTRASRRRGQRGRTQLFNVVVHDGVESNSADQRLSGHTNGNGILSQTGYPLTGPLGAGRVDPFHSYPIARRPYLSEVVDHYIVNMAVDISEIDGPYHRGLLRTRWFPFVMTEPATFLVVMLLSASHLYSIQKRPNVAVDLLGLKQQAISVINEGLADPSRGYSDVMVGAVAKMCSYEAMYGSTDSYMIHMKGLQSMVSARGGLSELGLDGMLRRICLWIDLNSTFLNKTPRFFEGFCSEEPNPGQFIGCWDPDDGNVSKQLRAESAVTSPMPQVSLLSMEPESPQA